MSYSGYRLEDRATVKFTHVWKTNEGTPPEITRLLRSLGAEFVVNRIKIVHGPVL